MIFREFFRSKSFDFSERRSDRFAARLLMVVFVAFLCSGLVSEIAFASVPGAKYVEGEALVLLKNNIHPSGPRGSGETKLTVESLRGAAGRLYIGDVAARAQARAVQTFDRLSEATDQIFVLMRAQGGETTGALIERLKTDPNVVSATPNFYGRVSAVPNDRYYSESVNGYKGLWGMERINAPAAWDIVQGGGNFYVAVIDSGIQASHPDLSANVVSALCKNFYDTDAAGDENYYDENGHGTHVAGTIGAVGNNQIGVAGVNWSVKMFAVRVGAPDGLGTDRAFVNALDYIYGLLMQGLSIPVVNVSYGGWAAFTPDQLLNSAQYKALKAIDDTDMTVMVVAAGNDGIEVGTPAPIGNSSGVTPGEYFYPPSHQGLKNMIVVGAIDQQNAAAIFVSKPQWVENEYYDYGATNWSATKVDVVAPGAGIVSTWPSGLTRSWLGDKLKLDTGYDILQGTSMAAPHVAGAVALLACTNPGLDAAGLKASVLSKANASINPVLTSPYVYNPSGQSVSRYGLLDVGRMVNASASPVSPTPPSPAPTPTPTPTPSADTGGDGGGCSTGAGVVFLFLSFGFCRAKIRR